MRGGGAASDQLCRRVRPVHEKAAGRNGRAVDIDDVNLEAVGLVGHGGGESATFSVDSAAATLPGDLSVVGELGNAGSNRRQGRLYPSSHGFRELAEVDSKNRLSTPSDQSCLQQRRREPRGKIMAVELPFKLRAPLAR